jgi:hypothetical protein
MMDKRLTAEELAEALSDFVNNFNHDDKGFIEAFCRQHRTLQQSMFRLMCKVIDKVASEDYRTDGRNEGTAMVGKMLIEGFKEQVIKKEIAAGYTPADSLEYANTKNTKPANYLGHI